MRRLILGGLAANASSPLRQRRPAEDTKKFAAFLC